MTRIACLLLIALLPGLLPAAAAADIKAAQEIFFEANRAYKNQQFRKAIDTYQTLIADGFANGHIFYNLGNAYYRSGDLGRAILFYERARLLIPRDEDLKFNLAHAAGQTLDAPGDDRGRPAGDFPGLDSVNLFEAFFVFALLNLGFFLVLGTRLFRKTEWSYYAVIFLTLLIGIGACALALKWYGWRTDNRAVVLSGELDVHAGPDATDTVLFKLHAGTIVRHEREEDAWALIHLSPDKRGWTAANRIERIRTFK